jgi:uncharacterized protein with HEPN domain
MDLIRSLDTITNHPVQDAVLKQIKVTGEAAKHLSPDFTESGIFQNLRLYKISKYYHA